MNSTWIQKTASLAAPAQAAIPAIPAIANSSASKEGIK